MQYSSIVHNYNWYPYPYLLMIFATRAMLQVYASYVNYSQPYTSYDPHAVGIGGDAPPHARNAALPPDSLARSRLDCSTIA